MIIPRVARRYAEAVYASVPESVDLPAFLTDLTDIRRTVTGSRDLRNLLRSPIVPPSKKTECLDALFDGKIGAYTVDVLRFLVDKHREDLLLEIIESVFEQDRARKGIITVSVTSAQDLSESQRDTLTQTVASLTRHAVEADFRTDDALLGGAVVRIGDLVYDGSILRQLQRLRAKFITGTA